MGRLGLPMWVKCILHKVESVRTSCLKPTCRWAFISNLIVFFFFYCVFPGGMGFLTNRLPLWVSPEFTLLREVSQVSLSNVMVFHLMLDLARRCRLGIPAWICSVQKCCRQHPACLKCPLTFHSRGNPCLCSLCVLHNSYLMHFFFSWSSAISLSDVHCSLEFSLRWLYLL